MPKLKHFLRDFAITIAVLALTFCASLLMQNVFFIPEQITTTFVFAVFIVALLTNGYFWGVASSVAALLMVNYAFTFPYFQIDFIIPSNFYSAVVMAAVAVMTSALTTKIKKQEAMKVEAESEKLRANLLRAISHDLRTPLTTIYGSSTALRENGESLSPEQRDKMLSGIQKDSQWLVRMVENLLSITRIDSGKVQIAKVPTALDELIDSVLVKFRKRYPGQNPEIDLPDELVLIPMDAILIEQVLINLLENAVYHAAGMTRIALRVSIDDGAALFEVSDDGCGIAQEKLPKLFTGYSGQTSLQPADHAKRNAGIGLSLCATIIHAHGGEISAENLPDGGAVFRFTMNTEENTDE